MIPCVLDNSITGMTGHQDNPGTGFTLDGEIATKISIEAVLKRASGLRILIICDPQDLKSMQKAKWTTRWRALFRSDHRPTGRVC